MAPSHPIQGVWMLRGQPQAPLGHHPPPQEGGREGELRGLAGTPATKAFKSRETRWGPDSSQHPQNLAHVTLVLARN